VSPVHAGARYLIAAGTAHYEHLADAEQLPSVDADVALVVDWFTRHGYTRVLPALGASPTLAALRSSLGAWLTADARNANDRLVFYYSGHGESVSHDAHYLLARDSQLRDGRLLSHSALPDDELARLFADSPIQHALVILDTCYSGRGIAGWSAKAGGLLGNRQWDGTTAHGIYLVSASRSREIAGEHAFAVALVEVLTNSAGTLGGRTQQYLDPHAVVRAINDVFARRRAHQRAEWIPATPLRGDPPELIPNPLFEAGRPAGLDLEAHWLPKARGDETNADAWYFTGRDRAVRELVAWLAAPPDGKARVVTGPPGTGKSAVLARLVTLSDPVQRARMSAAGALDGVAPDVVPAAGSIAVAVHARGKTLPGLVTAIAASLGEQIDDVNALAEKLRERAAPFTIVVDALDESAEPRIIARELRQKIATLPTVRLLVGTRADVTTGTGGRRVPSLGSAAIEIDLGESAYLDERDIEEYVTRLLLAEQEPTRPTPYRGRVDLARQIARAVARRATPVFLIARIVAHTLADRDEPVDVREPTWAARFPAEVGKAFDQYLDHFDRDSDSSIDKRAAIDLLRPLAFAEGAGLPREELWAAVASGLVGREYVDDDITAMLRVAGAFVVESAEHGRSVYRLYHQALAEWLREDRPRAEAHSRILDALVALVPEREGSRGRDWLSAHPYCVAHAATHAALANRLDELVVDPLFLAVADSRRLLRVLSRVTGDSARAHALVYDLVSHRLHNAPTPEERLAYLELRARQQRSHELLERSHAIALLRPFDSPWVLFSPVSPHRVIVRAVSYEPRLATVETRDGPVAVIGGVGGVAAHRLDDGTQTFETPEPFLPGFLTAAPPATATDPIVVATGSSDIVVLGVGEPTVLAKWRAEAIGSIAGLAVIRRDAGVTIAIIGHDAFGPFRDDGRKDTLIEIWTFDSAGPRLRTIVRTHEKWHITALAGFEYQGRFVLVWGCEDEVLSFWGLGEDDSVRRYPTKFKRGVQTLAAASADGVPLVVCGGGTSIEVLRIGDNIELAHTPRAGHDEYVYQVIAGDFDGTPCFASIGADNYVRMWRLSDSELLFEALVGLRGVEPRSVALARFEGQPAALTADREGMVRLWPCRRQSISPRPHQSTWWEGVTGLVDQLHVVQTQGGPRLVALTTEGVIAIANAVSGVEAPERIPTPDGVEYTAIAATMVSGRFTVAACDTLGVLSGWFADLGRLCGTPIELKRANAVRILAIGGRPHAALLLGGSIAIYDLETSAMVASATPEPKWFGDTLEGGHLDVLHLPHTTAVLTHGFPRPLTLWLDSDGSLKPACESDQEHGVFDVAVCEGSEHPVAATVEVDTVSLLYVRVNDDGRYAFQREVVGRHKDSYRVACAQESGELVIASATGTGQIRTWRGQREVATVEADCRPAALAFVPPHGVVIGASEGLMLLRIRGLFDGDVARNSRP
jgi:WD40 repeat protein